MNDEIKKIEDLEKIIKIKEAVVLRSFLINVATSVNKICIETSEPYESVTTFGRQVGQLKGAYKELIRLKGDL